MSKAKRKPSRQSAATATRRRKAAAPPPKRSNAKLWWGLGGAAVVIFIVAIVFSVGGEDDVTDMPEDVSVEITGEALPELQDGQPDPAIGAPAPEVSGVDFDNQPVAIGNDGRPKVIVFLAHWCSHCQREVPLLQSYIDDVGLPEGTDFYSVATSNDRGSPNWPPSAWLRNEGWTPPVLLDDDASSVGAAFGLPAFPYYVFVDADGNVAQRITGEQQPAQVAAAMEALAAE